MNVCHISDRDAPGHHQGIVLVSHQGAPLLHGDVFVCDNAPQDGAPADHGALEQDAALPRPAPGSMRTPRNRMQFFTVP